jgi:hypothetical protein
MSELAAAGPLLLAGGLQGAWPAIQGNIHHYAHIIGESASGFPSEAKHFIIQTIQSHRLSRSAAIALPHHRGQLVPRAIAREAAVSEDVGTVACLIDDGPAIRLEQEQA